MHFTAFVVLYFFNSDMFCKSCGLPCQVGNKFCSNCGANLESPSPRASTSASVTMDADLTYESFLKTFNEKSSERVGHFKSKKKKIKEEVKVSKNLM